MQRAVHLVAALAVAFASLLGVKTDIPPLLRNIVFVFVGLAVGSMQWVQVLRAGWALAVRRYPPRPRWHRCLKPLVWRLPQVA